MSKFVGFSRRGVATAIAAALTALSAPVMAQTAPAATDYSALTDAIDFSSLITALLAVGGLVIGVVVVVKGFRWLKSMI